MPSLFAGQQSSPGRQQLVVRVLVRRSPAKPDELAYHLTHAPEETTLAERVAVAIRERRLRFAEPAAQHRREPEVREGGTP
jgi:hypothetical protein